MVRSSLFSLALVFSAIIAASAACGGPGAGKSTFDSGEVKQNSSGGAVGGGDDDDDDTAATSSTSGAPAGNAVFGTTTFAYKAPAQNADDHAATHVGQTPLEGKDCVTAGCHLDSKPWGFAGTVYTKIDGTTTATEVEVGIAVGTTLKSAYTDAQGNFWLTTADAPPAGAKVGVRKAGGAMKFMKSPLPAAPESQACNSAACHGAPANRIFLE